MKILLANKFYYLKGGAERHFFDLKKLLEEKGHKIIPFAMQDKKNLASEYSQYFVSSVNIEKSSFSFTGLRAAGRIIYSFEAKSKIKELIEKERPDIAHIHNIYHQISPSILTPLKKAGIPIVATIHDFKLMCPNYIFYTQGKVCERCKRYRFYNCVLHQCVKNSYLASLVNTKEMYLHSLLKIYKNNIDQYICPSNFVAQKLIDFGFNKEKITILPHFSNFIDTEQNNYSHKLVNLPNSHLFADSYYILYFGRLSQEKGVNILLKAIKEIKNVKLKIAGKGPQEEKLKEYIKKEKINNVEFLGYLSGESLKEIIQDSIFTIMPSVCYETFGLSILESYIYGKPVIASDLGALKEIVLEGKTGLIFKNQDSNDLADKIKNMLSDKNLLLKMSKNAKKFTEKFNQEDYYKKLEEIYNKILSKN